MPVVFELGKQRVGIDICILCVIFVGDMKNILTYIKRLYIHFFTGDGGKFSYTTLGFIYAIYLIHMTVMEYHRTKTIDVTWAELLVSLLPWLLVAQPARRVMGSGGFGSAIGTFTSRVFGGNNGSSETDSPDASSPKKPVISKGSGGVTYGFNIANFESSDGSPMPAQVKANVLKVIYQLKLLADELGVAPSKFVISCGYRSKAYNQKLIDIDNALVEQGKKKKYGAATNSQHIFGMAVDFKVAGFTPTKVQNTLRQMMQQGKIMKGGIGKARTYTHYDIRGKLVEWTY